MGQAQASSLGYAGLPIAVIPHPFGARTRDEIRAMAEPCAADIAALIGTPREAKTHVHGIGASRPDALLAPRIEGPDDLEDVNRMFHARRWTDGLPIIPPTVERLERMLKGSARARDEIVATIAPGFGAATVERIAINAVLAGCTPEHLPVLIAATEAVAAPGFNLQAMQTTTHPVAIWLILNGPLARTLEVNGEHNCLGQGSPANAALGRALRLILQNVGGGRPGDMDRATQGQPGKYSFCCAENEAASPWPPLHVDRGFGKASSTVTVVGAAGTLNMNTHAKQADEVLDVLADSMIYPTSNDYWIGGEPWIVMCPEHAEILHAGGMSKQDVQRELWRRSKMRAGRMSSKELERTVNGRRDELGEIDADTMLPISQRPEQICILVAGAAGTHSVYVPSFGDTRSVTRRI